MKTVLCQCATKAERSGSARGHKAGGCKSRAEFAGIEKDGTLRLVCVNCTGPWLSQLTPIVETKAEQG